MAERYARLASRYLLRGWRGHPHALVDRENGNLLDLSGDVRYVLDACDGASNFASPAFLPKHTCLLENLLQKGIAVESVGPQPLAEVQRYRYADNPVIKEIHWAVTGRCNMACGHCFMECPRGRYGELDWPQMEVLVDQMVAANVTCVSLTGGEPLLCRHYPRLARLLSRRGITINEIATNGLLLEQAVLDFLKAEGQTPDLQISFDGVGMHDALRGTVGKEANVIASIHRAVDSGFFVAVNTTFSKENLHTAMDTYQLMKALRVGMWMLGRAQTTGCWQGGSNALDSETLAQACLCLQTQWLADGRPFPVMMEHFYEGKQSAAKPTAAFCFTDDSWECAALRTKAFLLPDATLLPCIGFAGTYVQDRMPNLLDTPLATVLSSDEWRAFQDVKKKRRHIENEECRTCEHWTQCGSGCRAYALTEAGNMQAADPTLCDAYRSGWVRRFKEADEGYSEEVRYADGEAD